MYIDGASKGNPGPSGIGVVICRDGKPLKNISRYIGTATNNVAEYSALIAALQEGLLLRAESISVRTDSELLCRQMNRQYRVKSPNIINLYEQAMHLWTGFKEKTIRHIPREENTGADRLATQAIKDNQQGT